MWGPSYSLGVHLLIVGLLIVGIVLFWALPVLLGVRWARQKGYSPLWMLFGIHPCGGWIAAFVMLLLPARILCLNCHQHFDPRFWRCPFCDAPSSARYGSVGPTRTQPTEPPDGNLGSNADAGFPDSSRMPPSTSNALVIAMLILAGLMLIVCSGLLAIVFFTGNIQTRSTAPRAPTFSEWTERQDMSPLFREFPASGKVVAADAPLEVGQVLHGEWAGDWYLVEVRRVLPSGNVAVYWCDWHHDEILPRTRLQFPAGDEAE